MVEGWSEAPAAPVPSTTLRVVPFPKQSLGRIK
jgi:hypothetical protein